MRSLTWKESEKFFCNCGSAPFVRGSTTRWRGAVWLFTATVNLTWYSPGEGEGPFGPLPP